MEQRLKDIARPKLAALLLLCVACLAKTSLGDPSVEFSLEEERSVGTEVGSLGDDKVLPLGLDASVRGNLGYNLLPSGFPRSSLFRVDDRTGQIFTRARIDRESLCPTDKQCDLDIQVAVQSAVSQFFKKVRVTIRVQDINDNPPTFPRQTTALSVPESAAVGTNFPLESATDLDMGANGVREYELLPNDGAFYVNLTKVDNDITLVSLVLRHELDRETKPVHKMVLTARDGSQPARSGSMSIVVSVEDVNDNAPVFDRSLYNVSLPEMAAVGTSVVFVSATDQDTDQYGIREYRFAPLDREDVTRYFAINGTTGQITVAGSLLEKQGDTFRILVECLDKGVPPLVSRAEVDVTVEDTVNSAPIISVNVMFGGSVSELAQSGTVVALVGVLDRDAGLNGMVSCSIVSDAFELQPLSVNEYKVIVVRKLDREAEPVLNVTVTCEDAGAPRMSSSVNFEVKVKDENDNAPVFSEPVYQKTIPENNRPGQVILKVTATDADFGENGRVTYNLQGADDDIIKADPRGNIIAVKSLDHETTPLLRFRVVATDNGVDRKSATADVVIEVTDINDEVPIFEKTPYEFEVSENVPENTSVGAVVARDKDSGENGMIVYSLLPKLSPFTILPNGLIVTKEILDREQRETYTITVYAEDRGRPPLTGSTTVVVRVKDQNDHKPRIIYPRSGNSTVAVSFDSKPGSVVLTILAEDEDEGGNKELEYHLASTTASTIFKLSKDKGELILQRALTPQDAGRHRLTVVVTDRNSAFPLFTNSTFDVIIFAPNETEASGRDKEKEHVLVVIILGVVTGVVTVAVIITIVVIRRADAQRRKYHHSRAKMVADVEKMETEKSSVGFVISNTVSGDGTKTRGGSHDGGSDDMSRDMTQDEGFADKSFNTSHGSGGNSDHQSDWNKALRLHQDLLKLHGVDSTCLMHSATGDDVTSDGSGESTTCDSGRGGSEEDNGSHGRASPVNKDMTSFNNLNNPPRPLRQSFGQRAANIPRSGFPLMTIRQLSNNSSNDAKSPTGSMRSFSAPPVKHVSFRDDFHQEWPDVPVPPRGPVSRPMEEKWGSTFGVDVQRSNLRGVGQQHCGAADLNLILDHSFDTGDDGNSTTTSGSYTVDDLSPRGINIHSYLPEQAAV